MAKKKKSSSNTQEVQNAAKTLFANIRFMSPDAPLKSIVLTSSVPNEGKTTTSVELARAIATSGKRTLLVEGDMRRRSLANILGVRATAGVYSVLTNQASLDAAIVPTKINGLFFLDVEPNIPNPADILSSKSYAALVKRMEQSFDYIIFDTPPVGTFVDAAVLSALVDGTVLVVKPGAAKRDEVLRAFDQLKTAGANVIGTCATFVEGTGSEYYYAYYTEGGKRVKKGDRIDGPAMPAPMGARSAAPAGYAAQPAGAAGVAAGGAQPAGAAEPGLGAAAGRSNTPRVSREDLRKVGSDLNAMGGHSAASAGSASAHASATSANAAANAHAAGHAASNYAAGGRH